MPSDFPSLLFHVGGKFSDFEKYYQTAGLPEVTRAPGGRVGVVEKGHIRSNPDHLILCKKSDRLIGHIIWHESNTEEHTKGGVARDKTDKAILRRLLGPNQEFVELHELWLIRECRGQGYGKLFFDFFENLAKERGFRHIVHYAFDPAAVAICRHRGYRDAFGVMSGGKKSHVLCLDLPG